MNAAVLTCTKPRIRRAQEAKVQRGRLSKSLTSKDKEEAHITREEIERDFKTPLGGARILTVTSVGNAEDLSIVAHEKYVLKSSA